jgi:hypothetical protein
MFFPAWLSRRFRRPSWLLPLPFLWFAWTCVSLALELLRSFVPTPVLEWATGMYLG